MLLVHLGVFVDATVYFEKSVSSLVSIRLSGYSFPSRLFMKCDIFVFFLFLSKKRKEGMEEFSGV